MKKLGAPVRWSVPPPKQKLPLGSVVALGILGSPWDPKQASKPSKPNKGIVSLSDITIASLRTRAPHFLESLRNESFVYEKRKEGCTPQAEITLIITYTKSFFYQHHEMIPRSLRSFLVCITSGFDNILSRFFQKNFLTSEALLTFYFLDVCMTNSGHS